MLSISDFLFSGSAGYRLHTLLNAPSILPGNIADMFMSGQKKEILRTLHNCYYLSRCLRKYKILFHQSSQLYWKTWHDEVGKLLFVSLFPWPCTVSYHFSGSLFKRTAYSARGLKLCVRSFQCLITAIETFIAHRKGAASVCPSSPKPLKGIGNKLRGSHRHLLSGKETLPPIVS